MTHVKMPVRKITRRTSLLFCFFFLLWYTDYFYHKREFFSAEKNKLLAVPIVPVPLQPPSSNTTVTETCDDDNDDEDDDIDSLEELNKKFCGQFTCKFLFVYTHGEQETKANLHFRSFTQLANKLNRIMILTNVGSSRIDTCKKFPFDFYYNTKSLQKEFPNVIFKTEEEFVFWLKKRDQIKRELNSKNNEVIPPLSILHSNIRAYGITPKTFYRYVNPINNNLHGCLSKFEPLMNLTDPNNSKVKYSIMDKGSDVRSETLEEFSKLLVKTFTIDEEILLIDQFVIRPLFPEISTTTDPIPYADHILNEAQKIKEKLSSSYIGIHWRLEKSRSILLPECVEGLIKELKKVMKEEGIKNIYLATDYPLLSSTSQSDTFKVVNQFHHDAIRTLNETFKINTWVSLGGLEQLRNDRKYDPEFISSGVQGILDKLVCINSNYFISSPNGCSKSSSFTKVIVEERSNRIVKNPDILNVVDRWNIF